jgi:phytoene dehydrogenase-like protein
LAHPLDDRSAVTMRHSPEETAAGLGTDASAYQALIGQMTLLAEDLFESILAPLRLPRHPMLLAGFGLKAIRSARTLARGYFRTERARALFAGIAGHSMLPLEMLTSAAPALALAVAGHAQGWPFAKGGSKNLTRALISLLRSLGGEVITGCEVKSLDELPQTRAVLLDVTPRQLLRIAGERLPARYRGKLERFRYGMGVFKMDWALSEPVPWRAPECRQAGTLHLGGTMDEISLSERAAWQGRVSERPFVLFAQATIADSSRAPAGKHTAWGYCHVPNGFNGSMVEQIENQIERFAPGFRDCVLARSAMSPANFERHNPNLVGGDIAGGAPVPSQLFLRPTAGMYRVPLPGVYLCSSSTPPAPGVHGMCGYFAAEAALAGALA